MNRRTAQRLIVRVGKELDAGPQVSAEKIMKVLRGNTSYDSLKIKDQVVARGCWGEKMTILRDELRLDLEFASQNRPYVELGEDGSVLRRGPEPSGRVES